MVVVPKNNQSYQEQIPHWVDERTPVEITIESIGVRAFLEPVGVTPNNAMATPETPDHVGWYALGPQPGESGNAVVAGHVNWWKGKPAVFANLHTITPGDVVTVLNSYGEKDFFRVNELRHVSQDADATDVFEARDHGAYLNLVTCDGVWDPKLQTHTMRLVVFTTKI